MYDEFVSLLGLSPFKKIRIPEGAIIFAHGVDYLDRFYV
jgi:hypothetical protein